MDHSYRIRLLSMACNPNYIFSIDGHNMTIIEVDGVNHEPLPVDSLQIFTAQRYSFIVSIHVMHLSESRGADSCVGVCLSSSKPTRLSATTGSARSRTNRSRPCWTPSMVVSTLPSSATSAPQTKNRLPNRRPA